ncbi:unnamed protein product [Closterium sp. Yama58-4]|nr:unnamed protein product [Closterium sp. Yama58-4]
MTIAAQSKADRASKPERGSKTERVSKTERSSKSEKGEKSSKTDSRGFKSEKGSKAERCKKSDVVVTHLSSPRSLPIAIPHIPLTSLSHSPHIPLTFPSHLPHIPLTYPSHPPHIPLTSPSHSPHIPLTSPSHPPHIPLTYPSHPPHIPLTSPSHSPHIPLTFPSHPPHIPLTFPSHPPHIPLTSPSHTPHIPLTFPSHPPHIPLTFPTLSHPSLLPTLSRLFPSTPPLPFPPRRSLLLLLLYLLHISPLLHSGLQSSKEEQQQMRTAAELDEYSDAPFDAQTPEIFRAAGGDSQAAEKTSAEEGSQSQSSRHGLVSSSDVLRNPSAFRELLAGKRGWWGEEGEGEDGGGGKADESGPGAWGDGERGSKGIRQDEPQERGTSGERPGSKGSREAKEGGPGDSPGSRSGSSSGTRYRSRSGSGSGGKPGAAAAGTTGDIPVVQFLRAQTGCGRGRYAFETLKQARRLNTRVILIGPKVCKRVLGAEGVEVEDYDEYKGVEEEFEKTVGQVVSYQVRWFILHEFMRRWSLPRIFYMDCDVLLFANITQFVHAHMPNTDLALAMRTPTIHVRAVSAHVSLWSQQALGDFLTFFRLFFQLGVVGGTPGDRSLPAQRTYNDMVVLGWYAAPVCWTNAPKDTIPKDCLAPSMRVMSARIRGRFKPAFKAESLCAPKQCEASAWSDAGWCAFDNNFSLTINHTTFHYDPLKMKTPTSMHYDHFTDWVGKPQDKPVQFLCVHFQGAADYAAVVAAGSSTGATILPILPTSTSDTSASSATSATSSTSGTAHAHAQSGGASRAGLIPVVQFLRGEAGCNRGRYMQASLRQALLHNTWVILIGPRACREEMTELGIELEAYEDYEETARIEEQYMKGIGRVMAYHIRWFFLHEMMVRRNISRVFYTDCDVLLFVNVTQFIQSHLPETKLALAMRSNSVRIRAVSGHVSLWSVDALADFLAFFVIFFQASASVSALGGSLPAMRSNSVRIRAVSGHVSLWSVDALADFLAFFVIFFQASASVSALGGSLPAMRSNSVRIRAVSGHVSLWSVEALADFLAFLVIFFQVRSSSGCAIAERAFSQCAHQGGQRARLPLVRGGSGGLSGILGDLLPGKCQFQPWVGVLLCCRRLSCGRSVGVSAAVLHVYSCVRCHSALPSLSSCTSSPDLTLSVQEAVAVGTPGDPSLPAQQRTYNDMEAVAGGTPGDASLPAQKRTYNDMVQLGWYASPACWTSPPDQTPKTCKDKERSAQYPRLHGKFKPAFKAESLCAPRQCGASAWSDAGWCAFDNNFSVGKKRKFHFCPKEGMKTPTSVRYEYFKPFVGRGQNKGEVHTPQGRSRSSQAHPGSLHSATADATVSDLHCNALNSPGQGGGSRSSQAHPGSCSPAGRGPPGAGHAPLLLCAGSMHAGKGHAERIVVAMVRARGGTTGLPARLRVAATVSAAAVECA